MKVIVECSVFEVTFKRLDAREKQTEIFLFEGDLTISTDLIRKIEFALDLYHDTPLIISSVVELPHTGMVVLDEKYEGKRREQQG